MRLIDADAMMEDINSSIDAMTNIGIMVDGEWLWGKLNDAIENSPTIEHERKKGQWIPVDSFSAFGGDEALWMAHGNPVAYYYCSNCKEQAYAGEDGQSLITDFCPNCGADMKNISEDPEDTCSGCDYYDLEDNNCRVFECFGIDCPKLPCEEGEVPRR